MKKNILFVHSGDSWLRGSEKVLIDIIDGLDFDKYNPILLCQDHAELLANEFRKRNLLCYQYPLASLMLYGGKNPLAFIKTVVKICSLVRKHKIDLIHTTSGLSNQYCLPAGKLCNVPVVAHIQGRYLRSSRASSLINYADHVISVSRTNLEDYNVSPERSKVIYNGVDISAFSPSNEEKDSVRNELGIQPGEKVVASVGSLIERKRPDLFLRIAKKVLSKCPNTKWVWVGDGPLKGMVSSLVDELGIDDNVILLGERKDVSRLLKGFDLFLLTSSAEALPLSLLEASSTGLPIVATRSDGNTEIVDEGLTGYLADVNDFDAYCDGCRKLLCDPHLLDEFSKNTRRRCEEMFSMEHFNKEMNEFYDSIFG